ncbi:MAG: ABC transporter ATP-binding protein [Polynucleobacter sp.]|jgi:branched-chain amino acid transport system ATP-binding protein|nr:ABC transporter ATP-binding protein [Polynucleobacter sp.]
MLEIQAISVDIQNSPILRAISLEIKAGELVCLVGRNGAGKTTTLKSVMGYLKPKTGNILLDNKSILGKKTFDIARQGIGFAPEESEVFGDLTVAENIEMSTWTIQTELSNQERIALAYRIFPKLEGYRERGGNHLSGGERKMLSIARALTLDPKLLILDEPFEGLSPAIIPLINEGLSSIRKMGRAILMAESNAFHIPDYADRVYVIERGEIVFVGSVEEAKKQSHLSMRGAA